jgi:hypothetical protein
VCSGEKLSITGAPSSIGQIVTLRLPASRVREANRVPEDTAWGAYRTEFFLSYDYKAIGLENHQKAQ